MTPTIERKFVTRLSAPRPRPSPAGNLPAALVISVLLHLLIYALLPRIQNAAAPFGFTSSRKTDTVSVALRSQKPEARSQKPEAQKAKTPAKVKKSVAAAKPAPRPRPNALPRPHLVASKSRPRQPIPAAKPIASVSAQHPTPNTQHRSSPTPNAQRPTPDTDFGIIAEARLSNAPPATPSPAPPPVSALPGQRPEGESRFAAVEPENVQPENAPAAKTAETDTTVEDLRNAVTAATQRSLLASRGVGAGEAVRGGTSDAASIPGEAISHGLPFRPADAAGVAPALNLAPVCIAYLVDVSGSMADGGKMERVRQALSDALNELKPEDSFTIVAFSDKAESLTGVAPLPATEENRRIGRETAGKLQPLGATNLSAALELAFAVPALTHIVVLSDGSPSEGITGRDELLTFFRARNASHARLIALSVSSDGAAQGADILALLAKESGGSFGTVNVGTPPAPLAK